ncbi:rhomboid family intramembrane serine protease [Halorutilales archaeon Cl-col2-1]
MDEDIVSNLAVIVALSAALVAVYLLERDSLSDIYERSRRRLVLGLPLGTAAVVAVNLGFYAFAQRGLWHSSNPLVIPYYSWSYSYPVGILASPISHANVGHITSNLVATAVFAPVAEYVVGHRNTDSDPRHRSVVRVVGFAVSLYVIGVFTSAFSAGPTVGFSGAVFALIGFITVFYPLGAVVLVAVTSVLDSVVSILQYPVITQTPTEEFVTPWWAQIAVDSHILGFFVGILVGALLLDSRLADRVRTDTRATKVGAAVVVVGVFEGIYALWIANGSSYVLYQSLGLSFTLLAGLGTALAVRSRPPTVSNVVSERISFGSYGYVGLLLPVLVICFIAVPVNVSSVVGVDGAASVSDDAGDKANATYGQVEYEGYEISYVDSARLRRVAPVSVPGINVSWDASGVVVRDPDRGIWLRQASPSELKSESTLSFYAGDLRSETRVIVERVGVSTPSGESAYSVVVSREKKDSDTVLFESPPAPTGVRVNGTNISVGVSRRNYTAVLESSSISRTVSVSPNSTPRALGVELRVENSTVVASDVSGETRAVVGRLSDN